MVAVVRIAELVDKYGVRIIGPNCLGIIKPGKFQESMKAAKSHTGEFAIVVADDFQSSGLGLKLLDNLIGIAQDKGLKNIYGIVLNDNWKIIGLAKKLGFTMKRLSDEESKVTLEL